VKSKKRERIVAILLILCITLVAGWEIASKMAAQPFDELRLKPEDFSGFTPASTGWSIRLVHLRSSPTEPTVIAYILTPVSSFGPSVLKVSLSPILVRIVHGYNMVDCMRIKQYKVDLLADTRSKSSNASVLPYQLWRLTSSIAEQRVWSTSMLRTADFSATAVDTRDMAFPRIGNPDDPSWAPTGLKWSSFRHPIRNLRSSIRAKWNASRCDIWTFLRLRQPAWASDEMLTMVSEYRGEPLATEEEQVAAKLVLEAHSLMLMQFQKFWQSKDELER
jgi:hypothetical protein